MSSVEYFREFVHERLAAAAAEEILGVCEKTIVEYKEEVARHRKLLELVWKPGIKLHRIGEEPQSGPRGLSHNSQVAESQDQKGGQHGETGSTTNTEPEPQKTHHKSNSHTNSVYNPTKILCSTHTAKMCLKCDTCGKAFKYKSKLQRHLSVHTGEKKYYCNSCGKRFSETSALNAHIRIHTGEKPYSCKTCGKGFRWSSCLTLHMRTHSGEKPYTCETCGRDFRSSSNLKGHMRTHTGQKSFKCDTCGKAFKFTGDLTVHMRRAHTGEKPYHCNTCGKTFCGASGLSRHIKLHTSK
ncbi:zinc finger protein 239-like [Enoplosus armatus]|uniref:zinc finger protein 239-like n=1 Tax=Enoplosus armatus TaxID=215367 RepID=UPI0039958768